MKLSTFALALVLVIDGVNAKQQHALRQTIPHKNKRNKKSKGSADIQSRDLVAHKVVPKRFRNRPYKICGKKRGKGMDRKLFPCVDYGDPGDDPIDESAEPTGSPSSSPSLNLSVLRTGSGSNKGTAVDADYEPYEVSGSNDFNRLDRTGTVDDANTDDGIGEPNLNMGGDAQLNYRLEYDDDEVPSNDVPSNDP